MISMARTLGAPDTVPAGSVARSTSIGPLARPQLAGDLRGEVHDVAVALQGHQLVDRLGAEAHHPPDVVAGQVDQHDVLGDLLGVLDQLAGQPAVLLGRAAPPAGAGDGPGHHLAVAQLDHGLGRRPDHGDVGVAQEVHVRAGVDLAQDPVHVEGVGVQVEVEALGQHDLEDVAGQDVLLGHLHRVAVRPGADRRADLGQGVGGVGRHRRQVGQRPAQVGGRCVEAGGGQVVGHVELGRRGALRRPARSRSGTPAGASGRRRPGGRSPTGRRRGGRGRRAAASGRRSTSRTTS